MSNIEVRIARTMAYASVTRAGVGLPAPPGSIEARPGGDGCVLWMEDGRAVEEVGWKEPQTSWSPWGQGGSAARRTVGPVHAVYGPVARQVQARSLWGEAGEAGDEAPTTSTDATLRVHAAFFSPS